MSAPEHVDRHWRFADCADLPDLGAGRYEIVDGRLVVTSPPQPPQQLHQLAGHWLAGSLRRQAPGPGITTTGQAPSQWGPVEVDLTTLPR